MNRAATLVYGAVCYAVFFATFLYLIGFLGNLIVPISIDGSQAASGSASATSAFLVNAGLILLFGLQHSVMARQGFKAWWTKFVPQSIERSTYVLASSVVLIFMFWAWRPMPTVLWDATSLVGSSVLWALFAAGWGLILLSTFLINHFELFGLQQVWNAARGRQHTAPKFRVPFLYKIVRHPLYLGWMIAIWATPQMTVGHLLFAVGMGGYMLIAIPIEERDLVSFHGSDYTEYKKSVPMMVPSGRRFAAPDSLPAPQRVA